MTDLVTKYKNNEISIEELLTHCPDGYKYEVREFLELTNCNLSKIQTYKEWLENSNKYTHSSVTKKVYGVISFVRRLLRFNPDITQAEYYHINEALNDIKLPKDTYKKITEEKTITKREFKLLLAESNAKHAPLLYLLWITGLRVSEALNIRIIDIKENAENATITVRGKGNKLRNVNVPKIFLKSVLSDSTYLFEENGKRFTRQGVTSYINYTARKVLNRDVTAHTLRHSFATRLIQRTNKTKAVSQYLGHSDTATTLNMYVHGEELSLKEIL